MHDSTKRLEALFDYGILDTPPEPEFDDIVQIAQRVCRTPVALVSLVADDRQWFKARVGFDACETPLTQSVCVYALANDDLLIIEDLAKDPRTRENTLVTQPPHIRFYAGAPLRTPEGIAIGSLCVIDTEPRPGGLEPEQAETLRALAHQTMIVMAYRKSVATRDAALLIEKRAREATLDRALASEAASDRMREAETRVREAQEAARIGAFEVDIAANQFQVTAEFCRIFGLSPGELFEADEIEAIIIPQDRGTNASSRATRGDATTGSDVEYRIHRQNDCALRWISRRSSFTFDEAGKPVRMLGVVQDVTERKRVELRNRALVTLGDQLRSATTTHEAGDIASRLLGETLGASRAGYAIVDEARETYSVETDWTAPGIASIAGIWPSQPFRKTLDKLKDGMPFVIANVPAAAWLVADAPAYAAAAISAQINVPLVQHDGLVGLVFVHSDVPRTWIPSEIDFVTSLADRTHATIAQLQAEAHQRVLNEELSHRLKNTLAMVQAIVHQTLRGIPDRDIVQALESRIIALSKAHDVLLQQSWTAAPMKTVIDKVADLHGRRGDLEITGPDVTMGPKATLSLSLLLHELMTNSIKYGAMSVDGGRVGLGWRIDHNKSEPGLEMIWTERGGPPASPPKKKGFGSRLIGMGLAGSGKADLDYRPEGLRAVFGASLQALSSN